MHLLREARGHALHIHLIRGKPFGFDEDLMAVLVRKAGDLILNGGAIARARRVDEAGIHGAALQVRADDRMRGLVGIGEIAGHLRPWVALR